LRLLLELLLLLLWLMLLLRVEVGFCSELLQQRVLAVAVSPTVGALGGLVHTRQALSGRCTRWLLGDLLSRCPPKGLLRLVLSLVCPCPPALLAMLLLPEGSELALHGALGWGVRRGVLLGLRAQPGAGRLTSGLVGWARLGETQGVRCQ